MSITGTRSDYGLMTPVYQGVAGSKSLELGLIVTGMHLLPQFGTDLETIERDAFGRLHRVGMLGDGDSGESMAESLGRAVCGMAPVVETEQPDILLVQGDRGEMLAAAICAAHMNIPIVHMSGGDYSGTIDESIRNAISQFAHMHLTTCSASSQRLMAKGEAANRIFEVGEPGLDVIRTMQYVPADELARELDLDLGRPIVVATQHPVTTEANKAGWQMLQVLQALEELDLQTVFTYPNTDAGGREMVKVIESWRGKHFLSIVPSLGSKKYLSLVRLASVMVGNSSSGIFESPSFRLPVVNVGTRQHGRLRAPNVLDVGYAKDEIVAAVRFALGDAGFRERVAKCVNPYGDGHATERTVEILERLSLGPDLISKWMVTDASFLA